MRFDLRLPLLILFLLGGVAATDRRASAEPEYPEWRDAFAVYVDDPVAGGELVLDLVRKGSKGLPPAALTVAGDAYLRRGNYGNARKMFLRALEDPTSNSIMGPGKAPISSHAELGLALASVGAGKFADAYDWFDKASVAGGDMGHLARLGQAQAAIELGRHDEALELLQSLNETENVEEAVVDASRFASANALLDAGDFEAAAKAFQALAADSSGDVARDAAYAAAVARKGAGQPDVALEALTVLVEGCPPDEDVEGAEGEESGRAPRPVSRAERDLDPGAILQSWLRNYREQPPSAYQAGFSSAFPLHACDLAVETIAILETAPAVAAPAAKDPASDPSESVRVAATTTEQGAESIEPLPAAASKAGAASEAPARSESHVGMVLVAVAVLVLLGWLWRRS